MIKWHLFKPLREEQGCCRDFRQRARSLGVNRPVPLPSFCADAWVRGLPSGRQRPRRKGENPQGWKKKAFSFNQRPTPPQDPPSAAPPVPDFGEPWLHPLPQKEAYSRPKLPAPGQFARSMNATRGLMGRRACAALTSSISHILLEIWPPSPRPQRPPSSTASSQPPASPLPRPASPAHCPPHHPAQGRRATG